WRRLGRPVLQGPDCCTCARRATAAGHFARCRRCDARGRRPTSDFGRRRKPEAAGCNDHRQSRVPAHVAGRAAGSRQGSRANDHRAVIVGVSEASPPFTTFPVIYAKYSNAMNYIGRTRKQMSFVLVHARQGEDAHLLARRIASETGLKALTWRDFTWAT